MKKTILTEKDYNEFYKTVIYGSIEKTIDTAVIVSYRDLCRTIRGFSKNKNHDRIFYTCVEIIIDEINRMLSCKKMTQEQFDKWHRFACKRLICFSEEILTYGQAQKWINMSLKNLSILDHSITESSYEYYHVPIDNYILNITNYKIGIAWSKIDSYDKYLEFQIWFRNKYDGIPLDNEFKMWLDERKK